MRIGFNARLLRSPQLRGWNRYLINLLESLGSEGVHCILYSDQPIDPSHLERLSPDRFETRSAPSMPYLAWEQGWLPKQVRLDQPDVFHCPFHFGMPWSTPCPKVLTLHDAIDEVYYRRKIQAESIKSAFNQVKSGLYHWVARNRADAVITVSECSKSDLRNCYGLSDAAITVVPEAADPNFLKVISLPESQNVLKRHGIERPYFFYIGGWEQRKNIPKMLEGFALSGLDAVELVLGGGAPEHRESVEQLCKNFRIEARVRLLGWVEDEELPALYANALSFVYPSFYEGFGLQLCEAMAVGCPVLSSNTSSLPEVLGTGGETFSPEDSKALSVLMKRVALDDPFRAELRHRSSERGKHFSWKQTALQTIAVYGSLLENRKHFNEK